MNKFIVFAGMGVELGALLATAFFIGTWIDRQQGTSGVFFLMCALIALVGWFWHLFVLLQKFSRESDSE